MKLSYIVVFTGLGLALAPLNIPVGPTKAFPGQSFVNGLAGLVLGPWAVVVAILISTIRLMLGLGTIFAFPGSIPGALLVGLASTAFKRRPWVVWFEPVGTLGIGLPLSVYVIGPALGLGNQFAAALIPVTAGWALSTAIGTSAAYAVALALRRLGKI
ncbi:energy coupling factor transporter S component ThiW [Thermoproteus tenax]|uniref:Predicted membrane protein n=1 Tax=Thermoproteus tenax (strain ATCC 35583 / DSM 2078 / JCM 9277 / NBRC 100435 / Kra 1) TaxID=768679 RepID=G4RK53_THETK|nr:energy coupling factor transporter S component ThiW [Thermoproteus tenax]CCC81948.1 Predicted membrane protein [Thermoproteus tenax Kra 1]